MVQPRPPVQPRPRRRPGPAVLAGLSILLLVLVIGGVWLVTRDGDDAQAQAGQAIDEADAPRARGQMTLDLSPTSGIVAVRRVTDQSRQQITVNNLSTAGGEEAYVGEVAAYDPGTFDPATLQKGRRSVVSGRDAWYVGQYVFPGEGSSQRTAALGWQDQSGTWLLAFADTDANENRIFDLEHLQRLAEQVVISPAHDLRAPFRLGWMPAGLTTTYIATTDTVTGAGGATVGLSAADRKASTAAGYAGVPKYLDLTISAAVAPKDWTQQRAQLSGATTVAGKQAWLAGNDLVVDAQQCVLRVHTAAKRPRADLERLVRELRVGDCSESDSWTAPAG